MPGSRFDPDSPSFFMAVLPLATMLVLMPTIEEARAGELAVRRPVFIPTQTLNRNYKYWALTDDSLREGRWWTLIGYMFLHKDLEHLKGNLLTICLCSRGVFRNLGVWGFYAVFFSCGAAAGANRWGLVSQIEAQLLGNVPSLPSSLKAWLPDTLQNATRSLMKHGAHLTAPAISANCYCFGASGAGCGLMGFNLGVWLLQGCGSLRNIAHGMLSWHDAHELLTMADCVRFAISEWRLYRGEQGITGIAHASHLTGLLAGVAFAAAHRFWHHIVLVRAWRRGIARGNNLPGAPENIVVAGTAGGNALLR
eukprot:NODE_7916_length_1538_cov_20.274274.p1 GENE.NODE_7916_length_1538_cov_20.274274~~NODE_7916_length_1538_cov_20.274274.p1  ORF type:complete len:309 (+),score=65.09 NODE_7916_length_1538_cov_20.274274:113-1039(+)